MLALLSLSSSNQETLQWMLRVCVAMTFLGHGYLATQTQNAWFTYLATAGIGNKRIGKPLMNLIGVMDICLAAAVLLVYPLPLVHAWCVVWGLATALMRPLSGESIHQFIERSGNFIPALALLWMETQAGLTDHSFDVYVKMIGAVMAAMALFCTLLRVTGIMANKTKQAKA